MKEERWWEISLLCTDEYKLIAIPTTKDLEQSHTFCNGGEPNSCKRSPVSTIETIPSHETSKDGTIKNELYMYFLIH